MSWQHNSHSMSSFNGFGRRRTEREFSMRSDRKVASGKSNQVTPSSSASVTNAGFHTSPSRDRIVYLSTCLIGHPVEVQLKNGSVYYGTCYTTNIEKEFAIILKMARMIKDAAFRGQKVEFVSRAPSKTLIIPGKEVVQVIAKDAGIALDGLCSEVQGQRQNDLMIDAVISKSRHVEPERELAPWIPDEDDPLCPELENIFDSPWNRRWDQFETNEVLFGVKSTFDEELYTTKLERGPWMREIERDAMRIAREIEGEDTQDLHIAEERGLQLHGSYDVDEETKYSSVHRAVSVDDSGNFDDSIDLISTKTFGASSSLFAKTHDDIDHDQNEPANFEILFSQSSTESDLCNPGINDLTEYSVADVASASCSAKREFRNVRDLSSRLLVEERIDGGTPFDSVVPLSKLEGPSTDSADQFPSSVSTIRAFERVNIHQSKNKDALGTVTPATCTAENQSRNSRIGVPSSSTSSNSDQEFKLNPNAKSFTPSRANTRPFPPAPESALYYPANSPGMPHMHGMPMGIGIGASFPGQQPVIFSTSVPPIQTQPAYFYPGGPQYGQQMIVNPRQVVYMPTAYQPDLAYKGTEF